MWCLQGSELRLASRQQPIKNWDFQPIAHEDKNTSKKQVSKLGEESSLKSDFEIMATLDNSWIAAWEIDWTKYIQLGSSQTPDCQNL